jgi:prepilin-type N-terminal cleavage/methylation domain-containing protein
LVANRLRARKGLTLIELLVAMAISAVLIAAMYRTFIGQHRTYTVQEQVVDMQQNARVAINRMMREIRMAGFGNVSMVLPVQFIAYGQTRTFNHVINPDTPAAGCITIITATEDFANIIKEIDLKSGKITVDRLKNAQDTPLFDMEKRKYISIGGLEAHEIIDLAETEDGPELTLKDNLRFNHPINTKVFPVRAISYQVLVEDGKPILKRDENLEGGRQPLAENIETIQFEYFDADGNPTAIPADIRMVRVTVTARTRIPDIEIREEGKLVKEEYRRRTISSNILVRNIGVNP